MEKQKAEKQRKSREAGNQTSKKNYHKVADTGDTGDTGDNSDSDTPINEEHPMTSRTQITPPCPSLALSDIMWPSCGAVWPSGCAVMMNPGGNASPGANHLPWEWSKPPQRLQQGVQDGNFCWSQQQYLDSGGKKPGKKWSSTSKQQWFTSPVSDTVDGQNVQTLQHALCWNPAPRNLNVSARLLTKVMLGVWFLSSSGANALQGTLTLNFGGEGVVPDRKGCFIFRPSTVGHPNFWLASKHMKEPIQNNSIEHLAISLRNWILSWSQSDPDDVNSKDPQRPIPQET